MDNVVLATYGNRVSHSRQGAYRSSDWVEGSVKDVDVERFKAVEKDERAYAELDGEGFEDDGVRWACDLADARKVKAINAEYGDNVLEDVASLFAE